MRIPSILLVSLLLSTPLFLMPAHGAPISDTACAADSACVEVDESGRAVLSACVDERGCALASACASSLECAALSSCVNVAGAPKTCINAANCTVEDSTAASQCALVAPCYKADGAPTFLLMPIGCIPGRRPLGWDACRGSRTKFSFQLFTGRDANGQGSAAGTPDPLWRAVAYPPANWAAPVLSGPAFSRGQSLGGWVNDPASSWINPFATTNYGPGGQYVFEARYVIPANAYSVTLTGRYAVDNSASVSDTDATVSSLLSTSAIDAFSAWTTIPTTSLATGLHTLDVDVWNRHGPSPVGANAQFTVQGYCKPKGPVLGMDACTGGAASFSILLNTGVDPVGAPLPDGMLDPHWTTGGAQPGPAFSHGQPPGGWVNDPTSSWINPFGGTGPAGLVGPAGSLSYQVNYFLPANAYNVVVTGKAAADNGARLADTDAWQSTYVATTPNPYGWASWTPFAYSVTTLGYHTFSADVQNWGGPTGLNVVAHVTGRCLKTSDTATPMDEVVKGA